VVAPAISPLGAIEVAREARDPRLDHQKKLVLRKRDDLRAWLRGNCMWR
jgi:hypothetical protein